jgi:hypothetical protein
MRRTISRNVGLNVDTGKMYRRLLSALICAASVGAQELPPLKQIEVSGQPGQSYWMFVPSKYTPGRTWPMLYCLDPGARGRVPVERFAAAAESMGVLVAGSNNSRNGPMGPVQEAVNLMFGDTHARFAIDDSRIFVAGHSGGSRVALQWALNGHIAGVIASGAAFGPPGTPRDVHFPIFAVTGYDDFNHNEMYRMSRELARRNVPHRYAEFEGGHEWLPVSLAGEALGFLMGTVPPQPAAATKEAEKQAAHYERLIATLNLGDVERRAMIRQAQKDAARESDSMERRVARQVIAGVAMGDMDTMRRYMAEKRYADAAHVAEEAVLARPENTNAWFTLAVASTASGNMKRGLEALEQAAAKGFRGWERVESEPLLAKLRRDARYAAILAKLKN